MNLTEKDERRFWAQVSLPDENGCMRWLGYTRRDGYATFHLAPRRQLVHRVAYRLAHGHLPSDGVIDHVKQKGCLYRNCCAPDHLQAVTQQENVSRGDAGAHQLRKTHCPQGHEYSERNTYWYPQGYRRCRTCARVADAAYRMRRATPEP